MSTLFGAIGDSINQDKGMVYGLVNNAISYAQSKKAQKRAYQYASLLQQQQYDLSQKGYLESPGNMRKGLETAGYNPMLALNNANQGVSVAGGTPVGANAVEGPNLTGSALDLQRISNETNQTESAVDANYANADKAKAEKNAILMRLPFISRREKAEINNIEKDSMKKESEIHNIDETTRLLEKQYELQSILANTGVYNAETNRLQYNIDKEVQDIIRDKEKRYKEWGSKHPYFRNIDETISRYFSGLSAGVSKSSVNKR